MLHPFYQKLTKHVKISLGYSWTPFSVKTIDWMHHTGPRILLSVTHMLYVNQACQGIGRCVKDGSCSSSSLSESQWTVLMGYPTTSTNVRRYQTHHRWQFSFQEDSALVHCACNTVQLLQRSRLTFKWKCDFRVSPFCQVVQKHKLSEVAY